MDELFLVRIVNYMQQHKFQEVRSSRIVLDLVEKTINLYWGTSKVKEVFSMSDADLRTDFEGMIQILVTDAEYDRRYGNF